MLIVSYFTPDYAEHAARLRASCAWERHWIEPMEDRGKWVHNCAAKAAFVQRAMQSQNDAVLWLDADAEIRKPIEKWFDFDEELDFAIHRQPDTFKAKLRFRSGTVWFNQTPAAHRLCEEWARRCEAEPDALDQLHLYRAWESMKDEVRAHWLPMTYCQRFDETGDDAVPDPHIVHYQASREVRKAKRGKFG